MTHSGGSFGFSISVRNIFFAPFLVYFAPGRKLPGLTDYLLPRTRDLRSFFRVWTARLRNVSCVASRFILLFLRLTIPRPDTGCLTFFFFISPLPHSVNPPIKPVPDFVLKNGFGFPITDQEDFPLRPSQVLHQQPLLYRNSSSGWTLLPAPLRNPNCFLPCTFSISFL